jgi:hypothetical protein
MAYGMICAGGGLLGLSGQDRCASFGATWNTIGPNLSYGRSIGQNAGLVPMTTTDLNNAQVRAYAGPSYVGSGVPISMFVFYDAARSFAWGPSQSYSVNEGQAGIINVITTGVPNGQLLYWRTAYTSQPGQPAFVPAITPNQGTMTVNNNSAVATYSVEANATPNLYMGTFAGIYVYKVYNWTMKIEIWFPGDWNSGIGRQVLSAYVSINDTSLGSGATVTLSRSGINGPQSLNLDYTYWNALQAAGWTFSASDSYKVGANNSFVINITNSNIGPGVTPSQGGLLITPVASDLSYTVNLNNTKIFGRGGNGADGLYCGVGYNGGPGLQFTNGSGKTLTITGSGYIAGGGGGGGGHGGGYRVFGGGGAGAGAGGCSTYGGGTNSSYNRNGGDGGLGSNGQHGGGAGGTYIPSSSGDARGGAGFGFNNNPYGRGGGQGGGGGACWNFTGTGGGNFQAGNGGYDNTVGGSARKTGPYGYPGSVDGGGGGWGAAGGSGYNLVICGGAPRAGGVGGSSIQTGFAATSAAPGIALWGAVRSF